jgi:dipeptidyl aminopeptidase/acylaminoacyl peptidase
VHGGLHTQTFPTWEAYIRVVTELGCDVIAVNHRGSTGIGQDYEQLAGDPVSDIIAARDFAVSNLKVQPHRIFLTGISTGSRLIATAAGDGSKIGGLILVSWPGGKADPSQHFAKPFPVLEFHGEIDAVMSPGDARQSIQEFFARDGEPHFNIKYQVFKGEGHFFYRTGSRAIVYWELSKLIQADQ